MKYNNDTALTPAEILMRPAKEKYLDKFRLWQGIPSIEKTSGGTLYAVFYSGKKTEESGNFAVVTRSDDCLNWVSPYMVIEHKDPNVRVYDPCLWIDPLGRLWITWAQSLDFFDGRVGVWACIIDNPDNQDLQFTAPKRIANGIMMNKPTVLKDGTWLFPCAIWKCWEPSQNHPDLSSEIMSNVYASQDNGKSFLLRGGSDVDERWFDEHMIVEKADHLSMLVRTKHGIGQSVSYDGGNTWSKGEKCIISGANSRFFIRRLHSGRLLLVYHDNTKKRRNLAAMLSDDDGKTWRCKLLLDERDDVSYPDGVQDKDGTITVVYDRGRYTDREILMAVFTEQDILAGKCVSRNAKLKVVINKATGIIENKD